MRKIYFLLSAMTVFVLGTAQTVPEILYYKFDSGTTIPNEASSPPTGATSGTITGLTVGGTGLSGTALLGTGLVSTSNVVNTGWATNLTGSWTIGFYSANVPASSVLFYIFGDVSAGSFRCFTNGVAGANNWILRATGMTDITATGGAVMAGKYIHFVYDAVAGNVTSYVNGVLNTTTTTNAPTISGSQFTVGGYGSNSGLSGVLDEFRVYSRALSAAEILATWNGTIGGCTAASNLAQSNVDCHTVDLTWVSDTSALGSVVEYGPVGFTPGAGTSVPATLSPFTLTGLAASQSYHVYVRDSCSGGLSMPEGPVAVTTLKGPRADFSYQQFQATINWVQYNFNATPSLNATSYTWYFGDGTTDTAKITSHRYLQNGPYTATLVAHNDCSSDSLSINFVISNISIDNYALNSIRIYPNPATSLLHFDGLSNEPTTIKLTDAAGKVVYQAEEKGEKHTISLEHLARGIYFAELTIGKNTARKKVVKL